MMNVDSKYRRWGWGAVIGLAGVILIAGLVVTATLSSTPETDGGEIATTTGGAIEAPKEETPKEEKPAEQKPAEEKPAEQKPAEQAPVEKPVEEEPVVAQIPTTSTPSEMPETGASNFMFTIVLMAVAASLVAYNRGFMTAKH